MTDMRQTEPMNRERWLTELAALMAPRFEAEGFPIPRVRVSVGFPFRSRGATIGQCWAPEVSSDGVSEIFISPQVDESDAVHVLVHELAHAAVGIPEGHKGNFTKLIRALGLEGKPTATVAGPATEWAYELSRSLPYYPHGEMDMGGGFTIGGPTPGVPIPSSGDPSPERPKQSTRLVKLECGGCGYIARTTRKWLDGVGVLHCPDHGEMREV